MKLLLTSGRTLKQGQGTEEGKTSEEYFNNVAVIELSKEDMEKLGVGNGELVKVETSSGSVIVKCVESKRVSPGVAFMPYGPWVNMLIDPETDGTGMPCYKTVEAEVTPAKEGKVLSLNDIANYLLSL